MKMIRLSTLIPFVLIIANLTYAQDTLPSFNVIARTNRINLVSWTNNYHKVSQINIQRSTDSVRNFKTILTVPDPNVKQNGFVDSKATGPVVYYRLFIVFDGGKYQFTPSRRPMRDTAALDIASNSQVIADSLNPKEISTLKKRLEQKTERSRPVTTEKYFVINKFGVYRKVLERNFSRFQDSIVNYTRDTVVFLSVDTVLIKPYASKPLYTASRYVYTEKYGNVMIAIPDAKHKKYSVSFFEENKTPLFEIDEVKSTSLIVDKTNFIHSGWFWFELFENGVLKERNRLFIPRDF